MPIDFGAISRVLGADVAERFGLASEDMSDLVEAPALFCLAYERSASTGIPMGQAMTELLDAWDAGNAG